LTGCASVISGTSQEITINTTPAGADCQILREGKVVGRAFTPETVKVERTKHDLTVECTKAGYQKTSVINESGSEGAVLGNILLGGGIGWAVDSARGADNEYQDTMNINLVKN
jgi:hypothetical protein